MDSKMNLEQHITNTCRSANYHLRKINYIRDYLDNTALKTLVQSTILPKLDYCNSLFNGIPQKTIQRIQLVQNNAVRVITGTRRRAHITPILKYLNWLTITKRCQYKLLVLTYKSLHGNAPEYFDNMLTWYTPTTRTLILNQYHPLYK